MRMFGMQILHGSIDVVVHGLAHVAQEAAGHAGHDTERGCDDVDVAERVGECLLQGGDTQSNDRRGDARDCCQSFRVVGRQRTHECRYG